MMQRDITEPRRFKIRYVFFGLLLLLLAWFAVFRISAYSKLNRRLRELSEAGYALSLAELEERYVLPNGVENAADYYLDAFSHYSEPNDEAKELLPWVGRAKKPARTEPVNEAAQQATEAFLAENAETLTLLH